MRHRIATLGPSGSCHESATRAYLEHHGITQADLQLVPDFDQAASLLLSDRIDFIVQGCAHPAVCDLLVRHHDKIFMVDTFMYPTKELGLLTRTSVLQPKSLGLMPVTRQYVDIDGWEEVYYEDANPIVKRKFVEGAYDSAVTFTELLREKPGQFRLDKLIGRTSMSWLVYARTPMPTNDIVATRPGGVFIQEGVRK